MSSTNTANTSSNNQQQQPQQQPTQSNLTNQDNGEPPFLAVGVEVSAKYKGAFCEARIKKVERLVKVRVTFKNNLGTAIVIDDNIKGNLRVGASIEAKHPDKNCFLEATISRIIDASQYTVIFDDGDITTLRRTSLCLKSGKHFAESESLDHLPLSNPEHFGNPVSLNSRGNRRRRRRSAYSTTNSQYSDNDDNESIDGSGTSVDDDDTSSILTHQSSSTTNNFKFTKESINEINELRDSDIGKVICVDHGDKRFTKTKDPWFPGLIVNPSVQEGNYKIDPKEDYLVKSFQNGRFYQLRKKDSKEFTKELGQQILNDNVSSSVQTKAAIEKALNYLERNELPSNWDYESLLCNQNLTSSSMLLNENCDDENESSDLDDSILDEDDDLNDAKSVEEKDRFVAQLFKYMDERGTPINKTPKIWGDDLDLYNLYRLVIKMGGYNRVTNKNGWKSIYNKLSLPNNEVATSANANQLRLAYKKYLLNFVDFWRKLGCTMIDTCMYSRGTLRAGRGERNWRSLSESTKQIQDKEPNKPTNGRRKKISTVINESPTVIDKKEDDDKSIKSIKIASTSTTSASTLEEMDDKKTVKRHLKKGRKKFKLDQTNLDDSNINGNEPTEKYIPNDSDFESENECSNLSAMSISKDCLVNVGDRIRVKYGKGRQLKVYEAKVMNILTDCTDQSKKYFVHYTGWNTRYDEWIKCNRIVEIVSDKSPKRRGGNKTKNKGVPLTTNEIVEKLIVSVKTEPTITTSNNNDNINNNNNTDNNNSNNSNNNNNKVEISTTTTTSIPVVTTSKPRGRPPSASTFHRNQEKLNSALKEASTVKVENSTISNNKKQNALNVMTPSKRSRQRSECIEPQEDSNSKQQQQSNEDNKNTESKIGKNEDSVIDSNEIVSNNKKLKRSDSELNSDDSAATNNSNKTQNNKAVVEAEEKVDKRQRKKKSENNLVVEELPATTKKRKISTQPNTTNSSSGDEDDSSNNTTNKFSKRKRTLNSKYRQDATETSTTTLTTMTSSTSSSSSSTTLNTNTITKETESTRKRSKEETNNIKTEKIVDKENEDQEEEKEDVKSIKTLDKSQDTNLTSVTTNDLLCKENEIPASPQRIDDEQQQQSNKNENNKEISTNSTNTTSSSTTVRTNTTITNKTDNHLEKLPIVENKNEQSSQNKVQIITNTTTITSTKLCSNDEIVNNNENENQNSNNNSNLTNQNDDTLNDNSTNKKENDETIQFTPPTTPESLKSNSTELNEQQTEQQQQSIKDKIDNNDKLNLQLSTHGLDIIAIASGMTKLGESEEKTKTSLNNVSNNFSPRKKRRGRGRTVSQSEKDPDKLTTNLFNTSNNNKDLMIQSNNKDNNNSTVSNLKLKACKTRGSLGRKVKQNQNNLDCNSESTSHSDNFEPTSPSILISTIGIGLEYNPTSKYNFCTPLDDNLESDKRIQTLQERLQELRKTYLNIKGELASLERRNARNKFKRKERSLPSSPGSQSETNKTNSPQSSTSSTKDNQHTIQRSNSFTDNMEINKQSNSNLINNGQVC